MLNGCDISEFQAADVDISPYDFVIVRSSYGVGEQDAKMTIHANRVLEAGKLLGFYHYAYPDTGNTGAAEARSMISCVKPYLGQCILALDWEGAAVSYPASWILEFMDTIKSETGVTPLFYTFAAQLSNSKYAAVAAKYPLWVAQWGVDSPDVGVWDKWTIWQWQGDPFDLDKFDGTSQDWKTWAGAKAPEWISTNAYLTQSQMENNALLIWNYFQPLGWTLNAVAAMLGNMEKESTINPGIWGNLEPGGDPTDKGYGLVQWTPYTRITDWLTAKGYELGSGPGECAKLQEEMLHPEIENTWHQESGYMATLADFAHSTAEVSYLAMAFLACYERPADPHQPDRATLAQKWYTFLSAGFIYSPRLTDAGMQGSKYWYSDGNPFYAAGYGLPNCTCYAYGRWWEITGERPTDLSLGNANTWWDIGIEHGISHGSTPQLGAIVCFYYSDDDGGGHVAVVEQINADGSIVTSNSAWGGTYFYTQTLYPPDYKTEGGWPSYGYVQGFLYLPHSYVPPVNPPKPPASRKSMPLMYYLKLL